MQKSIVIVGGLIILFFILFAIKNKILVSNADIRKEGIEGKGIVLKKYKNLNPKKSKPEYFIHVKVQGITIEYNYSKIEIDRENFHKIAEGHEVNILYLPSKPTAAVLK